MGDWLVAVSLTFTVHHNAKITHMPQTGFELSIPLFKHLSDLQENVLFMLNFEND